MYPLWEVPVLSAGFILGIIATFHILPSHLSTSAMWFNVFIETKAYRENRPELLEFIKICPSFTCLCLCYRDLVWSWDLVFSNCCLSKGYFWTYT